MDSSNNDFWVSTSDLMAGLMVIFLFIAIAYMMEMKEIVFGGAVLSMIIVAVTFIVSLSLFLYRWGTASNK